MTSNVYRFPGGKAAQDRQDGPPEKNVLVQQQVPVDKYALLCEGSVAIGRVKNPLLKVMADQGAPDIDGARASLGEGRVRKFCSGVVWVFWLVVSTVWPLLRWVVALDVVFQAIRASWYWNTPGMYAGWVFAAHFLAFVGLTYFVGAYKPREN